MNRKIDRMEAKALDTLENRWIQFVNRVGDRLERDLSESTYEDLSLWAGREADDGPRAAPEELPDRFREWWETFSVGFDRAESGVFPADTPEPPEVPSDLWAEAVREAESGDVWGAAVLAFARVRYDWED